MWCIVLGCGPSEIGSLALMGSVNYKKNLVLNPLSTEIIQRVYFYSLQSRKLINAYMYVCMFVYV